MSTADWVRLATIPFFTGAVGWLINWTGLIMLFNPVRQALREVKKEISDEALAELAKRDIRYHGWTPNTDVPAILAQRAFTVHVPRRFYVEQLPGIPTIRVFEALACGIPLLSAPWSDSESLFAPDRDFLMARSPDEMTTLMRNLTNDSALRVGLVAHGLRTILLRHTCEHRADELRGIVARLQGVTGEVAA